MHKLWRVRSIHSFFTRIDQRGSGNGQVHSRSGHRYNFLYSLRWQMIQWKFKEFISIFSKTLKLNFKFNANDLHLHSWIYVWRKIKSRWFMPVKFSKFLLTKIEWKEEGTMPKCVSAHLLPNTSLVNQPGVSCSWNDFVRSNASWMATSDFFKTFNTLHTWIKLMNCVKVGDEVIFYGYPWDVTWTNVLPGTRIAVDDTPSNDA